MSMHISQACGPPAGVVAIDIQSRAWLSQWEVKGHHLETIVKCTHLSFPCIVVHSFKCIVHSLILRKSPSVPERSVEPVESASQTTEENLSVAAYRLGYQWLLINTTIISINHFDFHTLHQ